VTHRAISHPEGKGPQLVVDDGGDANSHSLRATKLEAGSERWAKTKRQTRKRISKDMLLEIQRENPIAGTRSKRLRWCVEETHRRASLYKMHEKAPCSFPAITSNDSVTKSKFDNLFRD